MHGSWEVVFVTVGKGGNSLDELVDTLTPKQAAQLDGNLRRLEEHGFSMGGSFFDKVVGSRKGLREFRVAVQDCEVRFLFKVFERTFVMLLGYKKKRRSALRPARIRTAEMRLERWLRDT